MKRLISVVIIVTLAFSACSCGTGADETELFEALSSLAPRAKEIYGIIYGDALAHEISDESDGYYAVSGTAEYQSISELMSEIDEIFTDGYSKVLYNTAFYSASNNDDIIYAKFIEKNGRLYVNPKSTEDFGDPREFDLSGARVVKSNRYRAIIAVSDGESEFEVTMQKEDGEWKIDSALY